MENQENQTPKSQQTSLVQSGTQPVNSPQKPKKLSENILIKGLLVTVLILAMLIPVPFILNVISEREEYQKNTVKEVGDKFGGNQTLYGPFLKIPYTRNSDKVKKTYYSYVSPQEVKTQGDIDPVVKKRGIYNVILYHAKLNNEVEFTSASFEQLDQDVEYNWNSAELLFSVSNLNGLDDDINFMINGISRPSKIGKSINIGETKLNEQNYSQEIKSVEEILVPVSIPENKNIKVSFPVSLKGAGQLNFIPVSKKTEIKINTSIRNLKFDGSVLPNSSDFSGKNRTVVWRFPTKISTQVWDDLSGLAGNKFGMEVMQSHDEYEKTNRVAKYAILFIGLTFITFFFIEIINKLKIHPIQYVLVGLALSIFYLLLLSISEYIGFNKSYIISALATILLICWFIKGIVKKTKIMGVVFAVLTLLYSYIFVIIQLDELALLAGSIGLFIILALLMYFSRKIEWKTE